MTDYNNYLKKLNSYSNEIDKARFKSGTIKGIKFEIKKLKDENKRYERYKEEDVIHAPSFTSQIHKNNIEIAKLKQLLNAIEGKKNRILSTAETGEF